MDIKNFRFETLCVKEYKNIQTTEPHILPLYPTSSFCFENTQQGIEIFSSKQEGHVYARYGNPTVESVASKIAALEGHGLEIEPYAIFTSSGMSAISTLFLAILKKGDKIITPSNLYGGTTELFTHIFDKLGIQTIFFDLNDTEGLQETLKDDASIRAIYFESPSNPGLDCVDLKIMGEIGKEYNVFTVIDNTFCTPVLQQPLKYDIDFVIHSTTKFLNGHGNSISGIIIAKEEKFKKDLWRAMVLLGTNISPFEAWLVGNGLKTLTLRMKKHCQNALALAQVLENHPNVNFVNYLGLKSNMYHDLASKQMNDFGSMLSFDVVGGTANAIKVMDNIGIGTLAPTLGDVDTLLLHPATMSHRNIPKDIRYANRITDGLIRVSVGIENEEDILTSFREALDKI